MKKLLLLLFLIPNLVTAESIQDYFDNDPKWSEDINGIIYITARCAGILQVAGQHRIEVNDKELGQQLLDNGRELALISGQLALESGVSADNVKNRLIYWMKRYAKDSISNSDNYNNIFVGDFADDFTICYQVIHKSIAGN
jgi:hypothetical protein